MTRYSVLFRSGVLIYWSIVMSESFTLIFQCDKDDVFSLWNTVTEVLE